MWSRIVKSANIWPETANGNFPTLMYRSRFLSDCVMTGWELQWEARRDERAASKEWKEALNSNLDMDLKWSLIGWSMLDLVPIWSRINPKYLSSPCLLYLLAGSPSPHLFLWISPSPSKLLLLARILCQATQTPEELNDEASLGAQPGTR